MGEWLLVPYHGGGHVVIGLVDRRRPLGTRINDASQEQKRNDTKSVVRITLSTKFALDATSTSAVNKFTKLLNRHPFFQGGNYVIYSPNAFSKDTCDPKWTRLEWPCRGTLETCKKVYLLKTSTPVAASCWRYSFRWHLEEAKKTCGFMIQVVDFEGNPKLFEESPSRYLLGNGQKVESVMAAEAGTKIFRIYRPRVLTATGGQVFRDDHIDLLIFRIQSWYNGNCLDMKDCEVRFGEFVGRKQE